MGYFQRRAWDWNIEVPILILWDQTLHTVLTLPRQHQQSDHKNSGFSPFYLQSVYDEGGRPFWIHNTAPFGCLPYVLANLPVNASVYDDAGCIIPYNKVAEYFNQELKEIVVELSKELSSAAITYVDMYAVKYLLISQAEKYEAANKWIFDQIIDGNFSDPPVPLNMACHKFA
ncbi:hypothetical protein NE237_016480 [Protea cynaroides]|uniref:Uncharacterized protein n=1 Tax=Protea cynaroides TaxID=273540 RepID=A0A9Q0HG38_9MAGN|nr:hypothetical protein NE237_016480 [Protea cynaroides]